jgi:hypothetical protein
LNATFFTAAFARLFFLLYRVEIEGKKETYAFITQRDAAFYNRGRYKCMVKYTLSYLTDSD